MTLRRTFFFLIAAWVLHARLLADNNPPPSQSPYAVNPPYAGAGLNQPFPDAYYGADHGGSSITLSYPFTSQFGYTDHSRGVITYYCAPFTPRGSEGVYGMDVWLEQLDGSSWNVANLNGGVPDQGYTYQPVNTPNPGPSPSYTFTWTLYGTQLPPNSSFRIFIYVYLYNQGGGSQGNFYVASSIGTVNTGAANDAPRINWASSSGAINSTQVQAGQTYTISVNGQDDNGNLVAVSIDKNGQPFAYAGGGNGFSGNSQNPTSDPVGTVTYTAWATDSYGAQSPTITWAVNVVGKSNQASVSSSNATIPFYSQSFTPSYYGGSGSGGWQFCVGGYTNWDGGGSSYAGTNLGPSPGSSPGAIWVPSWSPPGPGSYQFWVANDGDANFNPPNIAGPYTLTVTPASPVGSFDGVSPNPVTQGLTISGSGWAADAQMGAPLSSVQILVDGGGSGSFNANLGGYRPDVQSANASWGHWSPHDVTSSGWSFNFSTASLSPGTHTFTAVAHDNNYGVSATIGSQSFTVSAPINQTVTISPVSPTIYAGGSVNFTVSGGANGYVWGGSASGGGGSQSVTFTSPGTFTVTVYSPAGNGYAQSNTATAKITVNLNSQVVSISPTNPTIAAGSTITFTAAGGQNGYAWGGSASGSGGSKSITFPNVGTYNVTVYSPAGGAFAQSNTASATITVSAAGQTVAISPAAPVIAAGQAVTFTASGGNNGYVWGGSAGGSGGSQTVTFPSPGSFVVTVYSPASGNYAQSNTATATVTVNSNGQTVSLSPANQTITAGSVVNFTANGGENGYVWGGAAGGGGNQMSVTFANVGTYTVTVYSPAGGAYSQSNTAAAAITVNPSGQTVSILPTNGTVMAGSGISFTAAGGQNGYIWGGATSGGGNSQLVIFPTAGTYAITVYSPAGGNYAQSNTASASIAVLNPTYSLIVNAGAGGSATGSATGLAGSATPAITATPGSGFTFVNWTGDLVANSGASSTTIAMNNANRTVTANFAALQSQTIAFSPPATALYPGPAITLTATASSGLPVSLSVISGPAALSGSLLTFTGTGTVIVQAAQGGGLNNGVYYQAAPSISRPIQVNAPFTIIRLRFNSPAIVNNMPTGNTTVDAANIGHSARGKNQASFLWTDPQGLQQSPWPTFNNPRPITAGQANVQLPLAPAASASQVNISPTGGK
jgi:uncharacterized repeat protein (TIGR02543 family)